MPAYTNSFTAPAHYEHEIVKNDGSKIGTIRVKPNRILWKPSGAHQFYSVPLNDFAEWITSSGTGATRTGS